MNKQEAAMLIQNIIDCSDDFGLCNHYNTALDMAKSVLSAMPDQNTGLMPCGCGGTPILDGSMKNKNRDIYVVCQKCLTRTSINISRESAIKVWNRAMGYADTGA